MGQYASRPCPACATIRASYLDTYVEEQVLAALQAEGGLLAQAVEASERIDEAARAVEEAEHELGLYLTNPKLLTLLGEAKVLEGAEARQTALDESRSHLSELRTQSILSEDLADGDLLRAWPTLTTQEKAPPHARLP